MTAPRYTPLRYEPRPDCHDWALAVCVVAVFAVCAWAVVALVMAAGVGA